MSRAPLPLLPPLTRRACLAQSLALAAAPARAAPGAPRHVTLNLTLEPDSLDPTMAAAAAVGEVVHYNIFEGLTRIGEDGRVSPLLAQSWQVDASQRRYTLRLRPGVRFHDGQALTADCVRFSFARAVAPGSTNKARKALFDNLAGIETPDPLTVVLQLQHPDAQLLFRLGESPAVILHPASAAQAASAPVGTGPYRLAGPWRRGQPIDLVRAPSWHPPAQVRMDSARLVFITDLDQKPEVLARGEIDLYFHYAVNTLRTLLADDRYQVLFGNSSGKGLLALNHRRAPLGDVRVRRAIAHAIDREAFIREVLDGRGSAIGSHFSPVDPGYVNLAHQYPYDPERARALLREAGVAPGLHLGLALPPLVYARSGAPLITADLARVGITLQPQALSWPEWLAGPFQGNFDTTLINHVEPLDYPIYTDPQYYFGYDSPAFRQRVAQYNASLQPRQRQQLWAQLQRHLAKDAVNAWLFAPQLSSVLRKGLRGVWMHYPVYAHDIAAMWWE